MPRIKAAKKALKQSLRRQERNTNLKRQVKDAFAEIMKLAKAGKKADAQKKLPEVFSLLDKAAKKHLFHRNKSSRKKSQLARLTAK